MKLTIDQKTVVGALVHSSGATSILHRWDNSHDRNLVVDELCRLAQKLGRPYSQTSKTTLQKIADEADKAALRRGKR